MAVLASRLDDVAASVAAGLEATIVGLDDLDATWRGPRPDAVGAGTRGYVESVGDVAPAVRSASTTVRAWAAAAAEHAAVLAVAECDIRQLDATPAGFATAELVERRRASLEGQIDEVGVSWRRCCLSRSDQLGATIAVVERCNSAEFSVGGSWIASSSAAGWSASGWGAQEWFGLAAAGGAHGLLKAPVSGLPSDLSTLLAVLEEIARRDDAAWQAVLDEAGVPPGEFVTNRELTDIYGEDTDEGGWYLIQMIHNTVADEVAAEASVFGTPTAVEGQSAGLHTDDIVCPPSLIQAIAFGVPYMVAEVKPYGARGRRDAREQLQVLEQWAEPQGAEVIRIGAPDAEGNPQLLNPQELANGELEFPTSGVFELYPNLHVVYMLTEPGIYQYRVYATGPLPDPDLPLNDDTSLPFYEQLQLDYENQEGDRRTPANVAGEEAGVPLPRPVPSGPERFA